MRMAKRVAYLGPPGTHSEQACLAYDPDATGVPFSSIPAAAAAVESGMADEAVVPIENSLEGSVTYTLDLLIHDSTLFIRRELVVPIKNSLVASDGTDPEDIGIIYSHPQPLGQCQSFLSKRFPEAELVASMSTSGAVKDMLERGAGAGAITTRRAAELHGVRIVAEGIDDDPNNMTRFVVLADSDHSPTGDDKTSVCFSFDEDAPGVLHAVLGEFSNRGINLTKIESRPTKRSLGRYVFLIDLAGHRRDKTAGEALKGVKGLVSMFKVFGSYPRYAVPNS